LCIQFRAIFSHVQKTNVTFAESFSEIDWQLRFRHITSQRAEQELEDLMNLIGDITLNEESDTRYMRFRPHKTFSVKACYYAINFGGATVLGNSDIWNSLASKNVIFLLGLPFIIGLILRKGLLGKELESTCPFGCQCDENLTHLLFSCPHPTMIWQKFLIPV
jgi:hypothetical protein